MEEAYHESMEDAHWPMLAELPIRNNICDEGGTVLYPLQQMTFLPVLALEDIVRDNTWRNHS